MGVLDRLFRRNRLTETPEAKAHRLREEAKRTVLGPNRGGGAKIITNGQVGAAYGVQAIDDRALELIQSGIRARSSIA